jgi:hypothetical protein
MPFGTVVERVADFRKPMYGRLFREFGARVGGTPETPDR